MCVCGGGMKVCGVWVGVVDLFTPVCHFEGSLLSPCPLRTWYLLGGYIERGSDMKRKAQKYLVNCSFHTLQSL